MFGQLDTLRDARAGPARLPTFLHPLLLIPYACRVVWRYFEDIVERSRTSGRLFGPLEQALAGVIVVGLAWQGGLFDSSALEHPTLPSPPDLPRIYDRSPAVYRSLHREDIRLARESHTTHTHHTHRYIPPPPRPGSLDELRFYAKSVVDQIQLPHVLLVLLVVNVVLVMLPDEAKERLQVKVRKLVYGEAERTMGEAELSVAGAEDQVAASAASARTVRAAETSEERQTRKAKERALAEAGSKTVDDERAQRKARELEKATAAVAAATAGPAKTSSQAAETPEERAKRKEKQSLTAALRSEADSNEVTTVKKAGETPEERAKRKALEGTAQEGRTSKSKAGGDGAVPMKKKDETPDERDARKAAEKATAERKAVDGADPVPVKRADETPEERLKRKQAERVAAGQQAQKAMADGGAPAKKPNETPEERLKRKEAERAALAKKAASSGSVKRLDETPEERAKRKAEKQAAESAGAGDAAVGNAASVPGETLGERAKRKVKDKAHAAVASVFGVDNDAKDKDEETPEERHVRREKEKADSAAAAGLVTADKAEDTPQGTEETLKRQATEQALSGKSRSVDTPAQRSVTTARKAPEKGISTADTAETPEQRLARKIARSDQSLPPAPINSERPAPVQDRTVTPLPTSAPLDRSARAQMEKRKAELRAQRLAAASAHISGPEPPASAPVDFGPASHPAASVSTATPNAPASTGIIEASATAAPAPTPPASAPIIPSDQLMEGETRSLKSVLKKPKKGNRQIRNIHHNQFMTMRGHRAALVPFPHGLHPPPHSPPHTLWWRNIPKDATHLMAHPDVPKAPEGLKPGEAEADEAQKTKVKDEDKGKDKEEAKKAAKDKESGDAARVKEKVVDEKEKSKASSSSSSRTPEEEKARALAKARAAKEAEAAKAAATTPSRGDDKEKDKAAPASSASSSKDRSAPSAQAIAPGPRQPTLRERQLEKAQLVTQMMLCALVFFLHEQLALCLMGFFAYQHVTEKRIKAVEAAEAVAAREAALAATQAVKKKPSEPPPAASVRIVDTADDPDKSSSKPRAAHGVVSASKIEPQKAAVQLKPAENGEKRASQLRPLMLSADPDAQAAREIRRQEKALEDLKAPSVKSSKPSTDEKAKLDPKVEARMQAKLAQVPPEKRAKYEKMLREQAFAILKKQDVNAEETSRGVSDADIAARLSQLPQDSEVRQPAASVQAPAPITEAQAVSRAPATTEKQVAPNVNEEVEKRVQRKLEGVPLEKRARYEKVYRERYMEELQAKQQPSNAGSEAEPEESGQGEEPVENREAEGRGAPGAPATAKVDPQVVDIEKEVERRLRKVPEEKRAKYAVIIRQRLVKEREAQKSKIEDASADERISRQGEVASASPQPSAPVEPGPVTVEPSPADPKQPWTKSDEPGITSSGTEANLKDEDIEEKVQMQLQDIPPQKREKYERIYWQRALQEREAALKTGNSAPTSPGSTIEPTAPTTPGPGSIEGGISSHRVKPAVHASDDAKDAEDIKKTVQEQLRKVPADRREEYENILWQRALAKRAERERQSKNAQGSPRPQDQAPEVQQLDGDRAEKDASTEADPEIERYVQRKLEKVPPEKRDKYAKIYRERAIAERVEKAEVSRAQTVPQDGAARSPAHQNAADTSSDTPIVGVQARADNDAGVAMAGSGMGSRHAPSYPKSADVDDLELEKIQHKLQKVPPEKRAKYYDIYREKLLGQRIASRGVASPEQPIAASTTLQETDRPKKASTGSESLQGELKPDRGDQGAVSPVSTPPISNAGNSAASPSADQPPAANDADAKVEAYIRSKLAKVPEEKRAKYEPIYRARAMTRKAAPVNAKRDALEGDDAVRVAPVMSSAETSKHSRKSLPVSGDGETPGDQSRTASDTAGEPDKPASETADTAHLSAVVASSLEVSLPDSTSTSRSTTPTDEPDIKALRGKSYTRAQVSPPGSLNSKATRVALSEEYSAERDKGVRVDERAEAYLQAKLADVASEKRDKYEETLRDKMDNSGSTRRPAEVKDAYPIVDAAIDDDIPHSPMLEDDARHMSSSAARRMRGSSRAPTDSPSVLPRAAKDAPTTHSRVVSTQERRLLEQAKAKRREERKAALESGEGKSNHVSEDYPVASPKSSETSREESRDRSREPEPADESPIARLSRPQATPLQRVKPSSTEPDAALPIDTNHAVPDSSTLPAFDPSSTAPRTANIATQMRKPSMNAVLDVQRVREALRRISETDTESIAPFRTRRSSSVGEHGVISFSSVEPMKRSTTPEGEPMSAPLVWRRPSGFTEPDDEPRPNKNADEGLGLLNGSARLDKGKGKMADEMLRRHEKDMIRGGSLGSSKSAKTARKIDGSSAKSSLTSKAGDRSVERDPTNTVAVADGSYRRRHGDERPKAPRLTPDQISQLSPEKREKYARYLAAKAKSREQDRTSAASPDAYATASNKPSSRSTLPKNISEKDESSDRKARDASRKEGTLAEEKRSTRIKLEDLTPEQVERIQKAREMKKRHAERAAKEARGEGSSGLSVDEKADLSGL